jgi:sulfofructose kinase
MLRFGRVRIPFTIPDAGDRPFDVVGLGLNSVDLVAVVAEFPASNTKQELRGFARMPGGEIATALVACARLGWRVRYLGSFGGDELGTFARESLVGEGVDVSRARIVSSATNRFAVILVDAQTGERTVLWHRHPDLTILSKDLPTDAVISGRILIVDGQEQFAATEAARLARQAGVATVVDVDHVRPGINELLAHIDAIVAAEEFPSALTGCADLGRALEVMEKEFSAPLVCVTLGADGSLARCNGREIRTAGYRVECVDSTGAGDVFRGALVAGCLRAPQSQLEEILLYANAVAALNCRGLGAWGGIPNPDDVDRFMATRSPGSPV